MMHFLKIYLVLVPVFFCIDFLWLGVLMSGFYQSQLGDLARRAEDAFDPLKWAALAVYILIPLGIVLFALPQVKPDHLVSSSMFWGFVYGIVLYGVYDMTNMAMLAQWPLKMSLVDILWGGVICSAANLIAAVLNSRLA